MTVELNLNNASAFIKKCILTLTPVYMRGPIGGGKSDITRQLGKELEVGLIDVRLSQFHPTEIQGLPFINHETKTSHYAPVWFLREVNRLAEAREAELKEKLSKKEYDEHSPIRAILFLDEINLAPPAVQSACYQLILDKRIGENPLHPGVMIVAAGNREQDKSNVYAMPAALKNRVVIVDIKLEPEVFIDHACIEKFHPSVISFIKAYPDCLHTFKDNPDVFATPRRWHQVSNLLKTGITFKGYEYKSLLGEKAGQQFHVFIKYLHAIGAAELVEQILEGKSINIFKEVAKRNEDVSKERKKNKEDEEGENVKYDSGFVMPAVSNIISSYIQRIGTLKSKDRFEKTDFIIKLIQKYKEDVKCGDANAHESVLEFTRTAILKTYQNDVDFITYVLKSNIVEF